MNKFNVHGDSGLSNSGYHKVQKSFEKNHAKEFYDIRREIEKSKHADDQIGFFKKLLEGINKFWKK